MNFNENPKQPLTLENLGEIYRKKLDDILYMELTVENINDFAKTAEKRLLKLNDEILKQYSSNPLFEANKTLTIKEQEDDAYKKLGLPNLQDILKLIVDKIEQINGLKHSIQVQKNFSNEIITPPQPGGAIIEPGAGTFVEKVKLPRLLTLIYILNNDLKIPLDDIDIVEGRVRPQMMRKTPYSRITVPSLNRVVYICDEEDNASYVFDAQKLEVHEIDIVMLDIDDKDEKNDLIIKYPGIGVRIIQTNSWRKLVAKALTKPIKRDFDQNRSEREINKVKKSEFIENLSFDEFQDEVRRYYQEQGSPANIGDWYKNEYKKHANWPSVPNRTYANTGWESWAELAGREKKEFLPFTEFKSAVIKQYLNDNKPGDIFEWYRQEYKRHRGWPSAPIVFYKNDGCNSLAELVGLERPEKKDFLPFADFRLEVQKCYQEQNSPGDIKNWYRFEYENHVNWPAAPNEIYADSGWESWTELAGREKKEFLPFAEFQSAVLRQYLKDNKPSNIFRWYTKEYNRHKGWPSTPIKIYKNDGCNSWRELVGLERLERQDFLPFSDLQSEVRIIYEKQGRPENIAVWYRQEYKRHKGWPSAPIETYKNDGWISWIELVGREKSKFLPFVEFQSEVQRLYREQSSPSGSWTWYKTEYKNHPNWPSNPLATYTNAGAESWNKIIGKENK